MGKFRKDNYFLIKVVVISLCWTIIQAFHLTVTEVNASDSAETNVPTDLLQVISSELSSGQVKPPIPGRNVTHYRKRVVVKRRKKLRHPSTALPTLTGASVPTLPVEVSTVSTTMGSDMVDIQDITDDTMGKVETNKKRRKHGHHKHKIPEVWKVVDKENENFIYNGSFKFSSLEKRDSESQESGVESVTQVYVNNHTIDDEHVNATDLHTEESTHPFINSSTPISNELQNSLQFTLQMLHPLLNADSVLNEQRRPDNKTVAVTHSLSDTFAQTPVAHDVGFLPTHLKKKHPLLNEDSIFLPENGASKTGIRVHEYSLTKNNNASQEETENSTKNSSKPTTPKFTLAVENLMTSTQTNSRVIEDNYETTTTIPTSTTRQRTTTSKKPTNIVRNTPKTVYVTPSSPKTTTHATTSTTTRKSTPRITTTRITPTTKPNSILSNLIRSTTAPPTTTPMIQHKVEVTTPSAKPEIPGDILSEILGELNITEINSGTSSEEQLNSLLPFLTSLATASTNGHQGPKPTTQLPPTSIFSGIDTKFPSSQKPHKNPNSFSSAEQALVEQLLGINSKEAGSPAPIKNQPEDSSEQLLKLFNTLVQNQPLSSPAPIGNASDEISLLTSLLGVSNPDIINFGKFPQASPTTGQPEAILTTTKPSTSAPGLSDADLKSIFEILDTQTQPTPTTTTTKVTTKIPTTVTTTTTTTTTTARPPERVTLPPLPTVITSNPPSVLTTTLHPALQSMLDLFTNQLKPFQNIPSSATTFLQDPKPKETHAPKTTTTTTPRPTTLATPTTTASSFDILSQLLNFGGGVQKVNPVRSTPAPEFSLASLFGGGTNNLGIQQPTQPPPNFSLASLFSPLQNLQQPNNNNAPPISLENIFGKNNLLAQSTRQTPSVASVLKETTSPSESNQLFNFFGEPTPQPPNGLYYWLDLNAFLGGDRKNSGIRPKLGNKFPFIKIS